MKNAAVKIIVAAHKPYKMPDDPMYIPLQVGAADSNEKMYDLGDDTGDNISALNPAFCELTGLYWAWKNIHTDYIGLVHYRRHFALRKKSGDPFKSVLTEKQLKPLLKKYKVFVPRKRHYFIETLYSHYEHTHYAVQLDTTRDIIARMYPEYLDAFDRTVHKKSGYMFNMMIMEQGLLSDYCSWLFSILMELKDTLSMPELSYYQGRYFGRIGEILLNVWLEYKLEDGSLKESDIRELPYVQMEKVNWLKKGTAFLSAKFFHKKYDGSF